MADISKALLRKRIAEILKDADLSKTSAKKVRKQLEEELDADFLSRKKEIDALVMEFVKSKDVKNGNTIDDDDEEEIEEDEAEEDEQDKKKGKRGATGKKPAAKKAKKDDSEDADGLSEDESEDDHKAKKSKPPKARKLPPKKKRGSGSDDEWTKKKEKRGGGGSKRGSGYTKALKLSPELATLVGQESMARHEVVKEVWAIIKKRNLYDPKNKQYAICDDALLKVIGTKRFRIFGMMKYLKDHFIVV